MTTHHVYYLSSSSQTRLTPPGVHSGMDITIQNISDENYVFVGGEGVNAQHFGYRISPGSAISFELPGKDSLYVIADADETGIAVLKTNLESGH